MNTAELYSIFLKYPVITTDSRNCPPNSLFFALKGEKFDGNDYIEDALNKGAAMAIGDRTDLPKDKRIIRVDNALRSLQNLANYHRRQINVYVIAVTGTNGKTTTKELIAGILSTEFSTLFTQGNLNNHIGVPLTLLQLRSDHRFAVIEMGANHPGEIKALCRIADPDFGLVTNVGKAHLEGFGSFEGVVRAKSELYDYLRKKQRIAFVNSDNPVLLAASEKISRICYGTSPDNFIQGKNITSSSRVEIVWKQLLLPASQTQPVGYWLETHMVGNYNFENILAAICVAAYQGITDAGINQAITDYISKNNRSQHLKTKQNCLIIDAYNANPSSMQAALDNFSKMDVSPKMLILGEMKELGEYSREEHQKIIDYLLENAFDRVVLCGKHFQNVRPAASKWPVFLHTQELLDYLRTETVSGFHILIKGSRTNQLEKTIEYL
jgi:UDP-N-acetylmuramoyl-tripeptide--D-alanyl-D-alanine ligase